MLKRFVCLLIACSFLTACASGPNGQEPGTKQTLGALIGAASGAIIGSNVGGGKGQIAAIAVGTLLGAFVGSEVGTSLDKADQVYAERSAHQALEYSPSGTTATWQNPDNGHSGTITPTNYSEPAPGQYCREYTQTVNIGGKEEKAYGKACRQPDGTWRVAN